MYYTVKECIRKSKLLWKNDFVPCAKCVYQRIRKSDTKTPAV